MKFFLGPRGSACDGCQLARFLGCYSDVYGYDCITCWWMFPVFRRALPGVLLRYHFFGAFLVWSLCCRGEMAGKDDRPPANLTSTSVRLRGWRKSRNVQRRVRTLRCNHLALRCNRCPQSLLFGRNNNRYTNEDFMDGSLRREQFLLCGQRHIACCSLWRCFLAANEIKMSAKLVPMPPWKRFLFTLN